MKNFLLVLLVIVLTVISSSCQTKKAQSSTDKDLKEVKEPKVYKDGYELIFKGSGHEPDWNVKVTEDKVVYTNIKFPEEMVFNLTRTTHIMDVAGIGYIGKNEKGEQVTVQVLKEECVDTMADKQYPFSVDVSIANASNMGQRGCGEFVEDERLGKTWYVETINGRAIPEVESGSRPLMKFDTKKNRLNANMGCNGIGGTYELMENRISFSKGFLSTQMYCEDIMDLERVFKSMVVGKTLVYSFKGQTLIFKNLNGVEMMTLKSK